MADTGWTWYGEPVEEMTREELMAAMVEMNKMYCGLSEQYHAQCEATGRMMDAALKWQRAADND